MDQPNTSQPPVPESVEAPAAASHPEPAKATASRKPWPKRSLPASIFKLILAIVFIVGTIFAQGIATVWAFYNLWDLDPLMIDVVYELSGSLVVIIAMAILGGIRYYRFDVKKIGFALKSCWWMLLVDTAMGIWDISDYLAEGTELVPNWGLRLVLIVVICIGVGISEEGMFRGLALGGLLGPFGSKKWGVVAACVLSSLAFGAIHVIPVEPSDLNPLGIAQMILKTLQTGVCGLIWAAVVIRSDDMWGVAFAHGLTDLPLMVSEALFYSGDMTTEYVASGEEEAIYTIVMYLIIIALYLPLVVRSVKILREAEAPDYGPFFKDRFQPEAFVQASQIGTRPMMLASATAAAAAPVAGAVSADGMGGVAPQMPPTPGGFATQPDGSPTAMAAPTATAAPSQQTYVRPSGAPVPPTGWHG